jgi:uncharacterized protein YndB with AHSA1/START domain
VSQQINRSPEAVFPYLEEPIRWDWMREMRSERAAGATSGIGARYRVSMEEEGKPTTMELEVTELELGHRVAFRTVASTGMRWDGSFSVEPREGGTLVRSEGRIRLNGLRRLLEPLMGGEIKRGEAAELGRLKVMLEAVVSESVSES